MSHDPRLTGNRPTPLEITPLKFEALVSDWLNKLSSDSSIPAVKIKHSAVVSGLSGEYRIDVLAEMEIFGGAAITILIECKHQQRPVERDEVIILEGKLRDTGAHKGMLFATSGFQSGALEYANQRGIATIKVADGTWGYQTRGAFDGTRPEPPPWMHFDTYSGIRIVPTGTGTSMATINSDRVDALVDWFREQGLHSEGTGNT